MEENRIQTEIEGEVQNPPEIQESNPRTLILLSVIFYPLMVLISLPFFYKRDGGLYPEKYFFQDNISVFTSVLWGICFGAVFVLITIMAKYLFKNVRKGEYQMREMLGKPSILGIFFIATASSVSEEIIFRALLQPSIGLWYTSLIFGILHPPPSKELFFYPIATASVGLGLGWMYINTGNSLIAPIIAHFVINLINLYRITRLPDKQNK